MLKNNGLKSIIDRFSSQLTCKSRKNIQKLVAITKRFLLEYFCTNQNFLTLLDPEI